MKSVTTSLAAAIDSPERVIRHRVTVDWDNDGTTDISNIDDMSHKIGQVSVDQSLESSLPTQVRVVPGAAVAQLDMTLARGNVTRYDVAAAYRSISTASSGNTPSQNIMLDQPSGAQPGELVIVAIFSINASNALSLLLNTNVPWATLAIRGDGTDFTNRVEGQCYIRRVTSTEPSSYTFSLSSAQSWTATAIRIGDPGLMGVHAVTSKGQDDNTTTYPILSGAPITTQLPNCTLIGIFGANAPVGGAAWSPLDGDVERADVTTTNAVDQCTMAVMTADNVAPGTYIKRATLSIGASVTSGVQFTVALAPRLAGDESQHAAWTFSELNASSPYAGKDRFGRRTAWKVGLHGEAGLEEVQVFTGFSISGGGASRSRTAEITALDNRETLRNVYNTFKTLVAENPSNTVDVYNVPALPLYPGLESTYLVSYELAYAFLVRGSSGIYAPEKQGPYGGYGYFASPPLRLGSSNCLWAPMHGSMEAFEGQVIWAYTQLANSTRRRVRFVVGPFVAGTEPAPLSGGYTDAAWFVQSFSASMFTQQRQARGRIEFWARFNNNSGTLDVYVQDNSPLTPVNQSRVTVTAGGSVVLNIAVPSITRTVTGPSVPTDGAWHFYGVHVDTPSGQAIFRVDSTSTVVNFVTWSNAANPTSTLYVKYHGVSGAQIAELQVHGGTTDGIAASNAAVILTTPITPWLNENFTPSAFIDKSENELTTFPYVDPATDVWSLLSAIAETEFAAIYFDGDGIPHFRNTRSDVSVAGQTIQKLLTSRVNLKDIEYSSDLAQIANIVDVSYSPHIPILNQVAWQAQGVIRLPPLSDTVISIQMPGLILDLSQGMNAFTGNSAPDGTGLVVSSSDLLWNISSVKLYGIQITLTNTTSQDVYLVDVNGQPTPTFTASWMAPSSATVYPVTLTDADSIRRFREQPLSVGSSVWRQRVEIASMWAQLLIAELSTPSPVIHNFPIVGDPRIQLGDLETLQDAGGLGVNGLFRVTAIKHQGTSNGGYGQSLTVRQASKVALWNINNWDNGTVWGI